MTVPLLTRGSSHRTEASESSSPKSDSNKMSAKDRAAHDWYRFVLSFPPHLVQDYLERWQIDADCRVLDPFCGTGTTIVECKKRGIPSVGIEANPIAHFACQTKVSWSVGEPAPFNAAEFIQLAEQTAARAQEICMLEGIFQDGNFSPSLRSFPENSMKLLLTDSMSPKPLHKTLALREAIKTSPQMSRDHSFLALARTSVGTASNLKFGPEVGVGKKKNDAPVIESWIDAMREMAADLAHLRSKAGISADVIHGDARQAADYLAPESVDAVFTSPPYPNEKDYSRTTRLEMVLLGFARDKAELQAIKRGFLRSNTRGVYKGDDDDLWVEKFRTVQDISDAIEKRRIEMGKTSGFERLYARVTKLYFGGMARHLANIRPLLRPGAHLGYVVGDQASYLRIMIRTGQILAEIAQSLGYEVVSIDLFRTRLATATGEMMREEVLVLRWPGSSPLHSSRPYKQISGCQ